MRFIFARLLALAVLSTAPSVMADVTPQNVAGLVPKWTFSGPAVTGGAIVRDGRVYVGTLDARVLALDPVTGAEIWSRPVGQGITGRVVALDDGGVCYGTIVGGTVGCLDGATGAVRWQRNVADPLAGVVWSAPIAANGRLFVGVAGLTDNPCTRGRLLALDLATGDELWRFYTVPEKVCRTDTAMECTVDGDCPLGGPCEQGVGGGVTATPAVDPTGEWVYMNTVGCYTFPSIGESDSMFKISASTGMPAWRNRVSAPEQFGACVNDTSIDCGVDADCAGVGGTCQEKAFYHDFGFLNGPLRIEVPDGAGTKPLIVSASKNGTLYAFDEATGDIEWTNAVQAEPVTPRFAGFGLFNGAINHADGRIFAALNALAGARACSNNARVNCNSDDDCPGATCPPEPKHLMAFDATTGATLWEDEIGRSYSHVGVANGVVYSGTRDQDANDASTLFAHDAVTGARLATFPLPARSSARAVVDGDSVFIGFGELGPGGLMALSLCGNGTIDAGETCDPGASGGNDCCSASCQLEADGQACDDAEACTSEDRCAAGSCAGTVASQADVQCALNALGNAPCGDDALPKALQRTVDRTVVRVDRLIAKARSLEAAGKTERAEKLRRRAQQGLQAIATKAAKAAAARKESKRITAECQGTLEALVASRILLLF